jgi:hypothetical protein
MAQPLNVLNFEFAAVGMEEKGTGDGSQETGGEFFSVK